VHYPFKSHCHLWRSNNNSHKSVLIWFVTATQTSATLLPNLVCDQNDAATKSTLIQQNQLQILFSLDGISFQLKSFLQRSAVVFVTTCVGSSLMIVISCCQVMPPARRVSWPFHWNQDFFFKQMWNISVYTRQWNCECWKTTHGPLTVATKPLTLLIAVKLVQVS